MKKTTEQLDKVLQETDSSQASDFLEDNKESMYSTQRAFEQYMRTVINEKGKKRQDIFLEADISEGYGYKLLSGEKRSAQRNVILRICYAAGFDLKETQRALKLYGFSELYSKIPRDALIMIGFNKHPGDLLCLNEYLESNNVEPI